MGFIGYVAANAVSTVLAFRWQLDTSERLVIFFVPPLAFIVVVTIATALAGKERIVFYQCACASILSTVVIARIAGMPVAELVDIVTIGIGVFLSFGRIGCFSVACCHGVLGRGVTYGPRHVVLGFWSRWSGRPLWPVQLVEAAAALVAVIVALLTRNAPGDAAIVCIEAYAPLRFTLELLRGDALRPYRYGVSEAQWVSVASTLICAVWRPSVVSIAVAVGLLIATSVLIARRRWRELVLPPHLHSLEAAMMLAVDGTRHETDLGVAVSRFVLPDGRIDWVLSSAHGAWSEPLLRRLATLMWNRFELVPGRQSGLFHVLESAGDTH
jgi:hypothetical protein